MERLRVGILGFGNLGRGAAAAVSQSPDMALAYLEKLADENVLVHGAWEYPGLEMSDTLFCDLIQEYCYTFFNIGSKGSYSAFYRLSGKMLEYYPDAVVFMDNLGSYYLVAENDFKTARKYYDRVLKKVPDDYTAIKNSVLIARRQKNTKGIPLLFPSCRAAMNCMHCARCSRTLRLRRSPGS